MSQQVLAMLTALTVCLTFAYAQDRPPQALERAVQNQSVVVRLFDPREQEAISTGTGFLIYKSDDDRDSGADYLHYATAAHVIDGHDDDPAWEVQVRFFGERRWLPAEIEFQSDADKDIAVLAVARVGTPIARGEMDMLNSSPNTGVWKNVWTLGYDRTADELVFRRLLTSVNKGEIVGFEGDGLDAGFSGGVVVSPLGRIALLQARGDRGRSHRGISVKAVANTLDAANVGHSLGENIVLYALHNARQKDLAITLYCLVERGKNYDQFWAAIDLDQELRGGAITGGCLTGGGKPKDVRTAEFAVSETGTSLTRSQALQWQPGRSSYSIQDRTLQFAIDQSVSVRDSIVLRSNTSAGIVYMAIPANGTELVPGRALVSSTSRSGDFADLSAWKSPGIFLKQGANARGIVNGDFVPFSFFVSAKHGQSRFPFGVDVKLSRNQSIVVAGQWLLPDTLRTHKNSDRPQQWSWSVSSLSGQSSQARRLGAAGKTLEMRFADVEEGLFEFFVDEDGAGFIPNRSVLFVGPTISYSALEK